MDSLQAFLHILSHTGGLAWTQCCENTVAQPSGLPRPCLLPHRQQKPSGSQKAALTRSRSTTTTVSTNRDPHGRQPPSAPQLQKRQFVKSALIRERCLNRECEQLNSSVQGQAAQRRGRLRGPLRSSQARGR